MLAQLDTLSVAAAVVQFVDFTAELISKANEVRKGGLLDDEKIIKDHTLQLISLNASLRMRKQQMY